MKKLNDPFISWLADSFHCCHFCMFPHQLTDITFLVGDTREPVCAVRAVLAARYFGDNGVNTMVTMVPFGDNGVFDDNDIFDDNDVLDDNDVFDDNGVFDDNDNN